MGWCREDFIEMDDVSATEGDLLRSLKVALLPLRIHRHMTCRLRVADGSTADGRDLCQTRVDVNNIVNLQRRKWISSSVDGNQQSKSYLSLCGVLVTVGCTMQPCTKTCTLLYYTTNKIIWLEV